MVDARSPKARVSTITQIGTITKYNFLNYFRARRFYVMLGIVLLASGALIAAYAYFGFVALPGSDAVLAYYSSFWGSFAALVVLLSAALFGGDAISSEFQNRTGYFLIPNPLRRSAVYVGKWLAAMAASAIIIGVYVVLALASGAYFVGPSLPWEFVESVAFALVYLAALMGLTFLFSSLFKSSAISIVVTIIILLFGFNIIDGLTTALAQAEPWFSITYANKIIPGVLLGSHYIVGKITAPGVPPGLERFATSFNPSFPEALAIMAVYFVVTATMGLWLFEKKEFTS